MHFFKKVIVLDNFNMKQYSKDKYTSNQTRTIQHLQGSKAGNQLVREELKRFMYCSIHCSKYLPTKSYLALAKDLWCIFPTFFKGAVC
jgi:hypothetical protein